MTNTATFIRTLDDFNGNAGLYELNPIYVLPDYDDPNTLTVYEYVIVSAIESAFDTGRPETLIFGADESGEILSYIDLPGSYTGGTDHAEALTGMGYDPTGKALTK